MMGKAAIKFPVVLLVLWAASGLMSSGSDQTGGVDVEISGIEESVGELIIGLFNQPDGFPDRGHECRGIVIPVDGARQVSCRFEDVPYGIYAIAVFHDTNLNGTLDKNLFGIPKEGVGLSRNARRPDFEKAKFDFSGQYTSRIVIQY